MLMNLYQQVCGAAVLGKDNIMKHAADLHGGRGAYQCQYCRKFFLRLNYLEMHRTYGCSQNPQRSRPLCDFCGRKFCQPQKLKVHIKRMHSGECHFSICSLFAILYQPSYHDPLFINKKKLVMNIKIYAS